jgi:phage minor structural protein
MLYIFDKNDNMLEILNFSDTEEDTMDRQINSTYKYEIKLNINLSKNLIKENKLGFFDLNGEFQLFIIKEITDTIFSDDIKELYCIHDYYSTNSKIITDKRITNGTCLQAITKALEDTNYNVGIIGEFETNVDINFYYISSWKALNNIAEKFGGEIRPRIEFNEDANTLSKYIDILNRLGQDSGIRFTYDTNVKEIKRNIADEEHYNVLYGRGTSLPTTDETGEETGGYTRLIDFADVVWSIANGNPCNKPSGQKYIEDLDSIGKYGRLEGIYKNKDIADTAELLQATYNKLQETKEPKVSYEADVEDIQDIEGYEHYSYKLGDTVIILDDDYDIDFESRIIQEKQSIKDKTRIITMGYILPSMSDTNSENATVGDNSSSSDKDDVVKDEDFPNTLPDPPILTVEREGFASVSLVWTYESKTYYIYEIYASQLENFNPTQDNLIFKGHASAFLHQVNFNETWYYRARCTNTHGQSTVFSKQVSATTYKIQDGTEIFENAAIKEALIESLNADKINAGKVKGTYIDARNLTVTDGNGDTTLEVSSDGEISIKEGLIQLNQDGIAVNHTNQENTEIAKTVMDEEGFRILDRNGNELADIGSQGSHFANLSVDGDFRHYPTAQIIDRQPNWNADYYVAKIATGDGTGRDEENKADSLQTVFGYMKSQGCMFFNKLTINIEAGVRIREKIVIRDFHGTLMQISLGKDAVLRLKEGSAIEDNYCRIQFYGDTNTNILDDDTTSEKINKLPCIEVEGDNGIRLASSSYVQFGWMRLRGKDNNSYFANLYTGANLHVVSCDISNVKATAYVDSTSRFTISYCRGNVEKLAYAVGGAMISKSVQVPKHINDSEIYYPAVDLSGGLAGQLIQYDTLFQDTYSNDTDTNTMRIFPAIKQYTEREGEGTDDTANLLNLVGQGKFSEEYKSLHGYAIFAEMVSKDTIKADTLPEFAESRESYKIYIRMTRADNNTTAPIPRVRFQLENGEYTAFYKLDPLTSPITGDGSGQITDYNATEDRELPAELADKLVKFGIYSIEFQGDTVEEYLIVDNIRLVIKGVAKKGDSGSIDTTEVKAIGKILANALNVRKTPGINGEYAGLLVNGDTVEIVGVDADTGWYKIKFEDGYAYITNKSEYVEIISGDPNGSTTVQKVEVLAENLNVRSGGSTSYNSIGIVSKGFVADILETDKDTGWYKISYNGEYGWITNNTTYVKVITGTATVISELYNGAKVAEFAESYYNARNNYTSAKSWDNGFTYGETTPCSSTASGAMGANYSIWEKSAQGNYWKMIDDSTLILLCLMGYSYTDSPYANLVNFNNYRANIMAKNSEYTGAIVPTSGTTLARTCAEIAKFFSDRGQTITVKTDYSNIQKGDLIFYAGKTSSGNYIYPNRWKCISNGAICIGQDTDGNAQLITAMSNPGEKHTDGWDVGLKKDLVKDYNTNTIVLVIRPSTKVTSGGSSSSGGTTGGGSSSGGITVSNMRQTICDTAMKIVNMGTNHTAWYSQYWRTTSLNNMVTIKGKVETVGGTTYYQPSFVQVGVTYGFDCSSLVGCCYEKAGMGYMTNKTCSMGTLQSTAKAHGATFWRYADSGFTRAKPGDIIMFANNGYTVTTSNMATVKTHHTAIYMGNGYIAEASGYKKGIIYSKYNLSKQAFFIRLPELDKADSASSTGGTTVKEEYVNCFNEKGTIDGKNYIYRLHDARCTCYAATESNSSGRSGLGTHMGKTVAAQNIPYGTKIYIPGLKGQTWTNANGTKVTLDGIFTVTDSGIAMFDFDIVAGSTSNACYSNYANPARFEVYILEWGTSSIQNYSFTDTWRIAYNGGRLTRYKAAFKNYISNGGVLINLLKFYNDDANIRSSTYWNILNS